MYILYNLIYCSNKEFYVWFNLLHMSKFAQCPGNTMASKWWTEQFLKYKMSQVYQFVDCGMPRYN